MDKAFFVQFADGVERFLLRQQLQAEGVIQGLHKLPVHRQAVAVSSVHVPGGHTPAHAWQSDGPLYLLEYFFHVFHRHDLPVMIPFLNTGQDGPGDLHQ